MVKYDPAALFKSHGEATSIFNPEDHIEVIEHPEKAKRSFRMEKLDMAILALGQQIDDLENERSHWQSRKRRSLYQTARVVVYNDLIQHCRNRLDELESDSGLPSGYARKLLAREHNAMYPDSAKREQTGDTDPCLSPTPKSESGTTETDAGESEARQPLRDRSRK